MENDLMKFKNIHFIAICMGLTLGSMAFADALDLKNKYINCFNHDIRGGLYHQDVVSTVVISPEVNGKRYFTSWVTVQSDRYRQFDAYGPQELESFTVNAQGINIRFPAVKDKLSAHYVSLKASATGDSFFVFESTKKGMVDIRYPDKTIFGKIVERSSGSRTGVLCNLQDADTYHDPRLSNVTIDENYKQSFHFEDMTYASQMARDLQDDILSDFVKKLNP
jgi:hypothetical protein